MTYPGDPSLSPDIRTRVLSTFEQTQRLAAEGKHQEALLGCDFILRLDPLFTPALRLQEELGSEAEPGAGAAPEALHTVRFSAEEMERMMADAGDEDTAGEIERGALAESDTIAAAEDSLAEASSFLAGARRAIDSGQIEAATRLLDMAASLDPHSPDLIELRAELDRVAAAPPDAAGSDRITRLLEEGQQAFDQERFQDAIDCWSRIFLIEIDHEEATRRIQLARDLRDEQDRQVEETFHQGVAAADSGDLEHAATAFRRVLELRPNHLAAAGQLEHLAASQQGAAAAPASRSEAAAGDAGVPEDLQVVPEGPARAADPTYRMAARAKPKPVNPFLLIGAGVLLLVAIGAWFLMQNWSRFFPNASEETAVASGNHLAEIQVLHDAGDLEAAIAAAEKIGSDDPEYLQTRRLLARWRQELASRGEAPVALSGDDALAQQQLVTEARTAYDEGRYLQSARLFTRASAMAPLAAPEAALFADAKRQLEPIAPQIDLYSQRQWELALPALWRRLEQAPDDRSVRELLVNSYFNLAVRELRRSDIAAATTFLDEADRLTGEDRGIERLNELVEVYSARPRDLLYDIYVQQLDFRR